jgi:hypothetical protein
MVDFAAVVFTFFNKKSKATEEQTFQSYFPPINTKESAGDC